MHLLVRDTRTLDEDQAADDLGQTPADIVVLSFSDADLGALAGAWQGMAGPASLRLASLARLRHPMSVDLYVDQVIAHARCVVIRLLGGLEYWRYGAEEVAALCRSQGIALALLPGDGMDDPRLAALSTMTPDLLARLDACFRMGGPANMARALTLAASAGGDHGDAESVPQHGVHALDLVEGPAFAAIVFYRSHLLSSDTAPIEALTAALRTRGMAVGVLYAASLKAPDSAAFVARTLRAWRPAVVVNATGFSARQGDAGSPLDAAGVPVLQVVLAGSSREAWEQSSRGLSQADLAMQVVLPELDGRLLTGAISFKAEDQTVAALQYARIVHRPDLDGIALAADRAAGWARLSATPRAERRVAIVLSDYPGIGGQRGHAVGLDSFASLAAILDDLATAGYNIGERPEQAALVSALCHDAPRPFMRLDAYREAFATLPAAVRERVVAAWGEPDADPALWDGWCTLRHVQAGNLVIALQPDRGCSSDRRASYHDADEPPRHSYMAFYLWLRVHAVVHLGTHGSLEWLPGKSVALSTDCLPRILSCGVPVLYPFIVNNPGEAAAAKRRLGAVTIGHLTPPMGRAGTSEATADLERMIDEYAAADGLDRRRTGLLRAGILERADAAGLLAESGVERGDAEDDALARLDAYLCDVKDLQVRDGLHVYGRVPAAREQMLDALQRSCPALDPDSLAERLDASAAAERHALLDGLDGRFVSPGPAGAPTRGRADVLPTGRNLTTIDPRAVPTRSALMLAEKAATELLRRHLQDHGEWPRALMIDVWGSASMRTGGEDLALALLLMGARPMWNESGRVSGFEVLPVALLDRPRVDVTLRISGLFRDAFESQVVLFDSVVRAIAARDEADDWNPLAAAARGLSGERLRQATTRIYGAPAGQYGAGDVGAEQGAAWLAASAGAYGQGLDGAPDQPGLSARVVTADAFVHQQDHAELDLLDSTEHAAHEGGFAAAAASLGASPALYHLDTSRPDAPRARTVAEEVVRVVRGRAANPRWIEGMKRHGYRGAAEIARGVEALAGFAATLPTRFDAQFELLYDATLGDAEVSDFLHAVNPDAHAAMAARFAEVQRQGWWHPRRNTWGPA